MSEVAGLIEASQKPEEVQIEKQKQAAALPQNPLSTAQLEQAQAKALHLARAGNFEEAEVLLESCLEATEAYLKHIMEDGSARDADTLSSHELKESAERRALLMAPQCNRLSLVKLQLLKVKQAQELATRAYEIMLNRHPGQAEEDHPEMATSLKLLGDCALSYKEFEKSEQLYFRAVSLALKFHGPTHPLICDTLAKLSSLCVEKDEYQKAQEFQEKVIELREQILGKDHADVSSALLDMGRIYILQGKFKAGEDVYWRAMAILEKTVGFNHPSVGGVLRCLGDLQMEQNKTKAAESLYTQSVAVFDKAYGEESIQSGKALLHLARFHQLLGTEAENERDSHFEKAEGCLTRAWHTIKLHSHSSRRLASCAKDFLYVLDTMNRTDNPLSQELEAVVGREDRAEPIMRQRQVNKSEEDEEENGVATSAAPPVPQDTAASPSLPASQQQHSEGNPGTPVQD